MERKPDLTDNLSKTLERYNELHKRLMNDMDTESAFMQHLLTRSDVHHRDQVAAILTRAWSVDQDGRMVDRKTKARLSVKAVVDHFLNGEGRHFRIQETPRAEAPAEGFKGANPWKPETFNLTKQGEIYRKDPELARRLAAEAGVRIGTF